MSQHSNNWLNNKREDFKQKLIKLGVINVLTNILVKLYELEPRPADPLEYIRTHMTEILSEKEELKALTAKHNNMVDEIQRMEEENTNLEKIIKIKAEHIQSNK